MYLAVHQCYELYFNCCGGRLKTEEEWLREIEDLLSIFIVLFLLLPSLLTIKFQPVVGTILHPRQTTTLPPPLLDLHLELVGSSSWGVE